MQAITTLAVSLILGTSIAVAEQAYSPAMPSAAVEQKAKNWSPPAGKIYAQALSDQIMAHHPELLSVTFHGTPPGTSGVYTMFAGSYPERIGNPDDPDDIDVITKGITIIDPRWHRTKDTTKKFVVQLPLRDATGENIGLLVLAFHNEAGEANTGARELELTRRAISLRDALQAKIPSLTALFAPASQPL